MFGQTDVGPSQGFMQRMKTGLPSALNTVAQNYGDPNSQRIARQTGRMLPQRANRRESGVPRNSPAGMTPASNITETGNAAPNPYAMNNPSGMGMTNIVRGPSMPMLGGQMVPPGMTNNSFLPQRTSPQIPSLGGGQNFWQMYNQMSPMGYR